MRLLFELQQDWRVAYWVVGVAKLVVAVVLWQTRHVWRRAAEPAGQLFSASRARPCRFADAYRLD
ncbi:MAG: hypothetical protein IPL28_18355 [Chloroflexi bacterium]|nr:hypothetical protein [Chloroflexota bacterium]